MVSSLPDQGDAARPWVLILSQQSLTLCLQEVAGKRELPFPTNGLMKNNLARQSNFFSISCGEILKKNQAY